METICHGRNGEVPRLEPSPLIYKMVPQEDAEQLYRMYPDLPKTHMLGCPSCGKNMGPYVDGSVTVDGVQMRCNCQDQLQRHKHYLNAGIGANYQYLNWHHFVGDQNAKERAWEYVVGLHQMVESGIGLFLQGEQYGVGKTMLAALVLKSCVMAGYRCYMTTFANMLSSMKAGWKNPEYAQWYKRRVESAQILLLDDVGKELMSGSGFNNDYARQVFDDTMRTRVQDRLPTFITTNFNEQTISQAYGEAVFSLITEQSMAVKVTGSDYRKTMQKFEKGRRRIY